MNARNRRSAALPNPEAAWRPKAQPVFDPVAEAKARVGDSFNTVKVLSGGQANLSLRLDDDRVLRIYTRDPTSLRKEVCLLTKEWQSFRVPSIVREGRDFLVLERIDLEPVRNDANHGRAVGVASAEIHSIQYERPGFLDGDLRVINPLPPAGQYASEVLERLDGAWKGLASQTVALLEKVGDHEWMDYPVLNHGDFKVSNLFVDGDDRLVILDWEFALSGPRFFDHGQLFRWDSSTKFEKGFEEGYRGRGALPEDWRRRGELLDLLNLLQLAEGASSDPIRAGDLRRRLLQTIER